MLHLSMHRLQKLSRTFPTFAFSLHLHIVFFQHTQYVRLPIQRFARQRNERDNPLRPVVLQSAGSDMQYPAHVFPVRYTSPFIAGRKFAVTLSTYFILRSRASKYACTSSMSFVITSILFFLYQFLAHCRYKRFHIFQPVIYLVVDLAVCQQSAVTVRLQRPFAHVQLFAHVRIIQPIHLVLISLITLEAFLIVGMPPFNKRVFHII